MTKILVLGGARSGKSTYAEQCAIGSGRPKLYIATATRSDDEMRERIDHHINRRDDSWQTIEEPVAVAPILLDARWEKHVILVDCLTLWLSNVMTGEQSDKTQQERNALVNAVRGSRAHIILVSNEVGLGIVPMHPLARKFRDEAGWLHQSLAKECGRVVFMAAGLPMFLKQDH